MQNGLKLIGIVGSRTKNISDAQKLESTMAPYLKRIDPHKHVIVSGGAASGADFIVKNWCSRHKTCGYLEVPAFWAVNPSRIANKTNNNLDRKAGHIRNEHIVKVCDFVLIFWDGVSPGTRGTIQLCKNHNRPHKIVVFSKEIHPLDSMELPKKPPTASIA